jgi:uncharacterized protein YeeX (DUF496 family)
MLIIENFRKEIEHGISSSMDLLLLRLVLEKYKDKGMNKTAMREALSGMRSSDYEDRILELLDFVEGYCRNDLSIF